MSDKIKDALMKLDVQNDNHWTESKEPRMDTIKLLAGDQSVTREQLEEAFPGFTRDTAPGFWMKTPEPEKADGANPADTAPAEGNEAATQAAQPPAQAAEPQGQGATGSPQAAGAGAAPQAEPPKTEGAKASDGKGGEPTPPSEAEQEEVEELGEDDNSDEIETLEAELEATQEAIADLQGQVDDLRKEIDKGTEIEQDLSNKLAKLRKNTKPTTVAIQAYLESQKQIGRERGSRNDLIRKSGLDLKELASGMRAPIDSAMSAKRGRGGKRPAHPRKR